MILQQKARLRQALSTVSLVPFDCSTPEGRSLERYRRLALTSFASAGAKGIAILTSLVSVPLTVNYLGAERYGMWMTASSVIVFLGFSDLGMGNGLVNAIARADGHDDPEMALRYVSSASFMLLGIATLLCALFAAIYPLVPWSRVFNVVSDRAACEAGPSMAVFVAFLAVSMPLGVVQRVQIGYQEGYKTHLWGVLGSLLGLGGVVVAVKARAGLPWLVAAMSGGPAVAMLFNWLEVFFRSRRRLLPRRFAVSRGACREVAGVGILFFLLQLMSLLGTSSDNLVIAHVAGPSAVSLYSITQKLFTATMVAQYFIAPLWPAFGEALARDDLLWARKTLNRALAVSVGVSAATALPLFLFGRTIIDWWVGGGFTPDTPLLAGFAVYVCLAGYGGVMSTLLNNGTFIRQQVVFFSVSSLTALVLKVILTSRFGSAGAIWATVLGYSIFYVVPAARLAYRGLGCSGGAVLHPSAAK